MATTSLAAWQERRSNLKDLQGQKELRTLCTLMDLGNEGRHAEAMDIVRQRILGTQAAKSQGALGKTSNLELTKSSSLTGGVQTPAMS